MRSRKTLLAVTTAALVALSGCTGGSGDTGSGKSTTGYGDCDKNPNTCNSGKTKPGGDYIFGLDQVFTSWNVDTAEGNTLVGAQALAGLVPKVWYSQPDGTLKLNGDLMASAELTNQSPQTLVYKIKPNAVWNDGTPISADDFLLQWKQKSGNKADCSACKPASTSGYDVIKSVVGSDNGKTVTVTFQDGKVYADWKSLFSTDGLYPAHLATKQGFDLTKPDGVAQAQDWFSKTVPTWSGGPFVIDSYNKDQSIVEKKNDKWYGATKSGLDKLVFKFVVQQASLAPAMQNKEVLGMNPQPNANLVQQVGAIPGVISYIGHGYQWEHIDANLANKYLADMALRQAIFTAINVKTIVDKTYGVFDKKAKPLGSHNFFPGDPHYKDVVTATGQGSGDLDKAKQILTTAGYTINNGKLFTKTGEAVPALRFRLTRGNQLRSTTAELVQAALKNIGIDVTIQETDTLGQTLTSGDYDLMVYAWVGSPLFQSSAEQRWVTGNGGNYGHYSNAQVDQLITKGAQEFNLDKAADFMNQADELMTKEAYVLPLVQKPTFTATYENWVNVRDNPTQWSPTYNEQEWGQKAS
jgi:peptide/nickel transport system substrate-binding protein